MRARRESAPCYSVDAVTGEKTLAVKAKAVPKIYTDFGVWNVMCEAWDEDPTLSHSAATALCDTESGQIVLSRREFNRACKNGTLG